MGMREFKICVPPVLLLRDICREQRERVLWQLRRVWTYNRNGLSWSADQRSGGPNKIYLYTMLCYRCADMPITKEQDMKILAYGQAGFSPQRILATMHEIGEPVSKSALYRRLARMRQNGEWEVWQRAQGIVGYYI